MRVLASSVMWEPSVRVSSPPVMGRMPRLLARRANSSAPQRFVSVKARAEYPYSFACDKQLVRMRSPHSKGEKTLGVKLGVPG